MRDSIKHLKYGRATEIKDGAERRRYRFFETLPGALSWFTLFLIIWVSWYAPFFAAVFIIFFDFYWLIKTIYLSFHLKASYNVMKRNMETDWQDKLVSLNPREYKFKLIENWRDIYHLIIFPMYKEDLPVVEGSFMALLKDAYPRDKLIVVLATEEAGGKQAEETANYIKKEFDDKFFKLLITKHPSNVPGEIAGKGSNETFAARRVKEEIIDPLNIPYEKIIVSVFDVDTNILSGYFSLLSYKYLMQKDALNVSFQPVPFFTNNIWEAPAIARVIAFSTTFWHMMQQERPERQTTFSSHSMNFKSLVEIDFWQTNMVSEDSRIFWQCYFYYKGNWRVESLHFPVMMDANVAHSFLGTMINVYKQQRRWGYGCENIPYIINGFIHEKTIAIKTKAKWIFNVLEGFHSWATNSLIIFFLGWVPLYLGGETFNNSALSYNLPRITKTLMSVAMLGLISSAVLSVILLPPKPLKYGKTKYIWMVLQWPLMLVTIILFGAFPGLESQTRLMLGKYMGFWVTPKVRK